MLHQVARTVRGRLLFTTWPEGLRVWQAVLRAAPEPLAVCVMPDHVHVLTDVDIRPRLAQSLSGLARWRNHLDGERGQLFSPLPPPEEVPGTQKQRRNVRYVHLNPCRAGLVTDPLAWPLSTHRDACGLAVPPATARRGPGFHGYVSADPSVRVQGTELPAEQLVAAHPMDVLVAVSAVCRVPLSEVGRHPHTRAAAMAGVGALCPTADTELAVLLDTHRTTLWRTREVVPAATRRAVAMAVGDPRFPAIDGASLLVQRPWSRYRPRRVAFG